MEEKQNSGRLTTVEKLGYAFGDTASNIFFQFVNIFLLYYYTDVFGLNPVVAGTIFLVTRIWDAVSDPMMGILADRTQTRWGKYRPYLLWLAVPFGLVGYLCFANPDLSDQGKIVYAYATYILLMTGYTAINVPYSALMGVMTPDPEERTKLASWRFFGAFSGGLVISLTIRPLVRLLGGDNEALGFQLTMGILSVVAVILFLLTFFLTREKIAPQKASPVSIKQDLARLGSNLPWLVMVVAAVLTLSNVAVRGAVTAHFFKYFVGDDGKPFFWFLDKTTLFLTTGSIAFILGILLTGRLSKWLGKRNALIALTLLNAVTMLAFYAIPAEAFGTMLVVNAIGAFLAGPTPALVWAIYTDVADYSEWRFRSRSTGLIFSGAMFAQKIGLAIGGGVSGLLLGQFGFIANQEQSPEAIDGIRLMFSIIPGVLAVLNGFVLLFYKLDDEQMDTVTRELAERRAADVA